MPKISLAGFKDPVRRPRFIVWTFVVVFALAAFVVVMLGATSTRWFCAEVCHAVQDDTIDAYRASSHSQISCMACHEPVNADTITFLFAKVKSGLEVIPTVAGTFELPLNPGSALALKGGHEMGSQQCTQCHSANRKVTTEGIRIDHKAHAEAGVWCTVCHNRVAHNEVAAPPKLVHKGVKNVAHPNFMTMDACFRCHDPEGKVKMTGPGAKAAPGACITCHPADFELLPASHKAAEWSVKAHGEAAREIGKKVAEEGAEAKKLAAEGIAPYLAAPVNECYTCHSREKFCTTCHGVEIPHPVAFGKDHKAPALKDVRVCQKCHLPGTSAVAVRITGIPFCESCHHEGSKTGVAWLQAHPAVVESKGTAACFGCHSPTVCAKCHVRGGRLP
jgi:nitrate/TMAO reductase-like tetraheme cytochrome c subunit